MYLAMGNPCRAHAIGKLIKSSVQKVNLVADIVRGLDVGQALLQLQFCKRKVAKDLIGILSSAIANAENNYKMDIDKLYVSEILVGKAMTLKRFKPKARGRAGKIQKRFSRVAVFLVERNN